MKALRLEAWNTPPRLVDLPVPEPGPGEVLIKIGGAGACHSDLHLMSELGEHTGYSLPFTLGHENAGWVEKLGSGVDGPEIGQPVAVHPSWGCGQCRACREGSENYCGCSTERARGGQGRDGGMAEYMLVPSPRSLFPLATLPPWKAAALTDAGLTSYHAIKRSLPALVSGSSAVVIGAGGLGHLAIQILRTLTPTRIIAVDRSEAALELAAGVGAHECVPADSKALGEIRKITGGQGVDVILDVVGADDTLRLARKVVGTRGQVIVIGLGGGNLIYKPTALPAGVSLVFTYGGSLPELAEVIALAEADRIEPHTWRFTLDQAPEVYEKLENGEVRGRAVIKPQDQTHRHPDAT